MSDQTYASGNISIIGRGDANNLPFREETTSGELAVEGFNNCPFCMKTDELALTWEKMLSSGPPYQYVFDVTLLCRGCGVIMDENSMDMAGAISSLHDRWNRRPSRDDFSRELLKARMYDKQEKWMKEELAKFGPFTPEHMEEYFDKSLFELAAALVSIKNTNDKLHKDNIRLAEFARDAANGNGDISRKLESVFYNGINSPGNSIGAAYYQGHEYWSQDFGASFHRADIDKSLEAYRQAAEQIGQSASQAFKGFAEGLKTGLSTTAPRFAEMLHQIQSSLPENVGIELEAAVLRQQQEEDREANKQKATTRSQRNQPAQLVDKRRR